ncbi:hypothetical protein SUGI_0632850 [Cryptomeria japonica]|nr:hypothetical protein SUGI_0632850 [Cryptomeria japonica]
MEACIRPDIVNFLCVNMAKRKQHKDVVKMKSSHQTYAQSWGTKRVVSRIFKDSIARPLWRKSGEVAMVVVQCGERCDRGKFEKKATLLAVEIPTHTSGNKVAREDELKDHLASEDEAKLEVNLTEAENVQTSKERGKYVGYVSYPSPSKENHNSVLKDTGSIVSQRISHLSIVVAEVAQSTAHMVQESTKDITSQVREGEYNQKVNEMISIVVAKTTEIASKAWGIMKGVVAMVSQNIKAHKKGRGVNWNGEVLRSKVLSIVTDAQTSFPPVPREVPQEEVNSSAKDIYEDGDVRRDLLG